MFVNNSLIYSNQTLNLTRDNSNKTYQIICASIGSRPDVTLSLYDTNSLLKLENTSNKLRQSSCNSTNNICTELLQVNFKLIDDSFDSMTSLACSTSSKNLNVPLSMFVSRNTKVFDYLTTQIICKKIIKLEML